MVDQGPGGGQACGAPADDEDGPGADRDDGRDGDCPDQVGDDEGGRREVRDRQGADRQAGPVAEPREHHSADAAGHAGTAAPPASSAAGPGLPTSRIITAAMSGLPKIDEIAAADPAAAMMAVAVGSLGGPRPAYRQQRQPAADGDQGRLRSDHGSQHEAGGAARTTPGRALGWVAPACMPSAGTWPPWPGRWITVSATRTPASPRAATGHHAGALFEAELVGEGVPDHVLELVHGRQEAEGQRGDRDPHQRGHDQHGRGSPGCAGRRRCRQSRSTGRRRRTARRSFPERSGPDGGAQ